MDPQTALFVRYRQGDVTALGQVFDATAPKLLRLAMHLARSSNDAEDLLQSTFVLAMQKAETFDATRPLLPWLCGILAGQARNLARSKQRHATEALPELAERGVDPSDAAARTEFITLLRSGVKTLSDEQRQVLLLQLQHGLSATEIAEVLNLPPGAVRMRMHRGVQALRRLLPTSLALWLAAKLPARGLATVRAQLLQMAAGSTVATNTVTTFAGVLVMKKLLLMAVLTGVVALLWLQLGATTGAPTPAASATTNDALAQRAPNATPDKDRAVLPVRMRADTASKNPQRTVRIISASSGAALCDVAIRAWSGDQTRPPLDPFLARTNELGEAIFDDLVAGPWSCQPLTSGDQPATTTQVAADTLVVELLQASRPLQGIVVDVGGSPVADAGVQLCSLGMRMPWREGEQPSIGLRTVARSGADGTFTCEHLDCELHVAASHPQLGTSFSSLTLPMCNDAVRLVLRKRQGVVSGIVRDGNGQAIAGARIACKPMAFGRRLADGDWLGLPLPIVGRSDAQGHFRFETLLTRTTLVWAQAPGTQWAIAYMQHAQADSPPVVLTLGPAQTIQGTLHRADGTPVEGVTVHAEFDTNTNSRPSPVVTAADGSFTVNNLSVADHSLSFARPGQATLMVHPVAAQAGVQRVALVLPERPCLTGQLLHPAGHALAGWQIRATDSADDSGRHAAYAITDLEGRFALPDLPANFMRVDVFPRHVHEPALTLASVATDQPLVLRLPDGAMPKGRVHGRIVDASGRALADVSVELRDADETSVMATDTTTQSGSFDFGALSPRSYSLIARSSAPLRRASQPCEILADESFAIGDLVLQEPAILDIELVRSDGSAWRGMRPDVFFRDRDGYSSPLQFEPSPQGFRAIVEPGEFRLSVGEPDLVADPVSVQLAPADNQTVRLVVTIASRRDLVFAGDQAVKIDSKDVLNVTVTARDGTEFHKQLRRSPHGDGDWTLEHPFAIGNYTVSAVTDSGRRYAVTFEVTETIGEAHRIQVPLQN